jgi:hypothetical protein
VRATVEHVDAAAILGAEAVDLRHGEKTGQPVEASDAGLLLYDRPSPSYRLNARRRPGCGAESRA